jgi:peptidoglycan LD-endopeptidase CwlK
MLGLGTKSEERLATVDPQLAAIVREVASWFPLTVIEGHRNQERQDQAFREGKSKLQWPKSKHNRYPSLAVDIAPLKLVNGVPTIDWSDWKMFGVMAGIMQATARIRGVRIRWGADWDSDWNLDEEKLKDGPHFELVEEGIQEIGS